MHKFGFIKYHKERIYPCLKAKHVQLLAIFSVLRKYFEISGKPEGALLGLQQNRSSEVHEVIL